MVESESQFIRRRQKLGRFVAAAILALGFLGSLLTLRREQAAANNRDDRSASLAAEALNDSVNRLVSSLRGGDGLVADGAVSAAEFKAFAQDVLNGAPYSALAREAVVLQADRDAFEAATKLTIRDTDG